MRRSSLPVPRRAWNRPSGRSSWPPTGSSGRRSPSRSPGSTVRGCRSTTRRSTPSLDVDAVASRTRSAPSRRSAASSARAGHCTSSSTAIARCIGRDLAGPAERRAAADRGWLQHQPRHPRHHRAGGCRSIGWRPSKPRVSRRSWAGRSRARPRRPAERGGRAGRHLRSGPSPTPHRLFRPEPRGKARDMADEQDRAEGLDDDKLPDEYPPENRWASTTTARPAEKLGRAARRAGCGRGARAAALPRGRRRVRVVEPDEGLGPTPRRPPSPQWSRPSSTTRPRARGVRPAEGSGDAHPFDENGY